MAKDISTLVEDIYGLMENGVDEVDEDLLDRFGDLCKDVLRGALVQRERVPSIRMSNIGKPDCQTWHELHGTKGEPLRGPTLIKFAYGHVIEALILSLAETAGHSVENQQYSGDVDGVTGHIDCTIDGQLVDAKSCSNFAFNNKFLDEAELGSDDFGYYGQASGYEGIMHKPFYGWLAVNKETGAIRVSRANRDNIPDVHETIARKRSVESSDTFTGRCFEPVEFQKGGNLALCVTCSYCPFKWACWSDANDGVGLRSFLYANKPVYLVRVEKLPKVPETTDEWRINDE